MSAQANDERPMRRRRRPAQVRTLLIGAAQQVFAARGYSGATTAEIATAAGVAESALFRHFATKAELFATAALVPFADFMTDFTAVWERRRGQNVQTGEFMRTFVTELFDHVQSRRDIVIALLNANDDESRVIVDEVRDRFTMLFAELEGLGRDWESARGVQVPGLELNERLLVGLITAMVVFDRWFLSLPGGAQFEREAVIDALIEFARHGAFSGAAPTRPIAPARATTSDD
jgi:AcrR family transcriptional regulator